MIIKFGAVNIKWNEMTLIELISTRLNLNLTLNIRNTSTFQKLCRCPTFHVLLTNSDNALLSGSSLLQPASKPAEPETKSEKWDLPELEDIEPEMIKPIPDDGVCAHIQ